MSSLSPLHQAVLHAFQTRRWEFRPVAGMEVVESWFEAHHTRVFLHAQTHAEPGIVSVVSNSSFPVPRTHLKATAELLMRANKELNLGNLEVDWDSGQVMFRVANIFPTAQGDDRIIASLVHTAVVEMDRITPYLAELCRLGTGELMLVDIPGLLAREDLLPAVPEAE